SGVAEAKPHVAGIDQRLVMGGDDDGGAAFCFFLEETGKDSSAATGPSANPSMACLSCCPSSGAPRASLRLGGLCFQHVLLEVVQGLLHVLVHGLPGAGWITGLQRLHDVVVESN